MTTPPYAVDQLISAKSIAARVEALAAEITDYFRGTDKLVVIGLLRGSFIFIADTPLRPRGVTRPTRSKSQANATWPHKLP